jgi:hypothetical protein
VRFLSARARLFPDQLATPAFILRTDNPELCIKDYKYPKPDLPQAIAPHSLLTHAGELRKRVSLRNPFSGDKTLYIYAIDKKAILDKIGGGVESWGNLSKIVHEFYNYLQISLSLWCCPRWHS